jgi:ribosome-associated toxin RatA of RatAB toxin-antitoxin module
VAVKCVIFMRMRAQTELIFALAAEVERWTERLPHYRYVRRLPDPAGELRFAMGARRGLIPVRWEAVQRPRPDDDVIEFVHTGGVTRGMAVAWRLRPDSRGVEVSIEHQLSTRSPVAGAVIANFIEAIATRTLRRVKELAEAGTGAAE